MKTFKFNKLILIIGILCTLFSCKNSINDISIFSPNGNIRVKFGETNGEIFNSVVNDGKPILLRSQLGFTFTKNDDFSKNFKIINADTGFREKFYMVGIVHIVITFAFVI